MNANDVDKILEQMDEKLLHLDEEAGPQWAAFTTWLMEQVVDLAHEVKVHLGEEE